MDSQLISIPLKKTENLDWIHPLKNFFKKNYGTYQEFNDEIILFNKLRIDAKSCNQDFIGRDILYRYYGQLELFDLRIPVNDHDGVHVSFTWYDAFKDSKKKVTQNSIAFEKACILFNLASLQSELACSNLQENDESKKDYKMMCQSLQNAAGIFRFITEYFLNPPSNDLSKPTIEALEQLMLAQAQEVFLLKILNTTDPAAIKHSLVAKLSKSCAQFYNASHDLLNEVSEIDSKWVNYCKLKCKLYNSVAYYHQSMALKETKAGEAISFLRQARKEIEDYKLNYSYAKYTSLETNCKKMLQLIEAELPLLEKDNDYIYHHNIPGFETLTLKGLDGVKSISINDQGIDKVVGKDIFEKIIPYSVQEQSSRYTEMAATLLRGEDEKIIISDEELKSVLEYLNLPLKLDEIKVLVNNQNEGDDKARKLSVSQGDDYNIDQLRTSLNQLKKTCNDKLNEINRMIDLNNLQYNDKVMDIRENIAKTRQSLLAANETDVKIENLIRPYEQELKILQDGHVTSFLQNDKSLLDVDIDQNDLLKDIDIVEKILSELNSLKYERSKIYKELKQKVHNDDISKILILNKSSSNFDEIFENELLKFKPDQNRIDATNVRQQELVQFLKKNFKKLLTNQSYISLSKDKQDYDTNYARLLKTFENFNKYKNGHSQASKFYRDLLNFISNNLEFEVLQIINTAKFSSMNISQQQQQVPPIQQRPSFSNYSGFQQQHMAGNPQQTQPPPLPPQQQQTTYQQRQGSTSIYDQPSNFDPSMYSKFS